MNLTDVYSFMLHFALKSEECCEIHIKNLINNTILKALNFSSHISTCQLIERQKNKMVLLTPFCPTLYLKGKRNF